MKMARVPATTLTVWIDWWLIGSGHTAGIPSFSAFTPPVRALYTPLLFAVQTAT